MQRAAKASSEAAALFLATHGALVNHVNKLVSGDVVLHPTQSPQRSQGRRDASLTVHICVAVWFVLYLLSTASNIPLCCSIAHRWLFFLLVHHF